MSIFDHQHTADCKAAWVDIAVDALTKLLDGQECEVDGLVLTELRELSDELQRGPR